MKLASFCVAAILLSSNVFAQAKATDLAPTPVTTQAQTQAGALAAKSPAAVKSTKKVAHSKKSHKHAKSSAMASKKRMHTASVKNKRAKSSVAR